MYTDATLALANIKGLAYKGDIRKVIDEAKTSNMPDLGNVLCRWYEEKSLSLENTIQELHKGIKELQSKYEQETAELKERLKVVTENTRSTKSMIYKSSRKQTDSSGRKSKRFKTVDNQLDIMRNKFSETMAYGIPKDYSDETETIKTIIKQLRNYHRVVVCGSNDSAYLQAALISVDSMNYANERCFELTRARDWWSIGSDEADVTLVVHPFGRGTFDRQRASKMSEIFDSILYSVDNSEYGFFDVVIVTEKSLLEEFRKHFPHKLIEDAVTVYTADADETIDLSKGIIQFFIPF
ncbi:uncharacterized protein LOC128552687 [Mercenaria mercenaria]|uniref:uncharacterized protein LOC128552687 n=1 Tax=Mercenaria mercenaria TaxID=6596 RepID=UPI00234F8D4E|nr:uncharacterized protein LOC128552687 [Mercenaria mercenaria]